MGKPFLINYELAFIPNFFEPNGSGKTFTDNSNFSTAMNHKFSFDYQVGRASLIGAGIGYSRTGFNFTGMEIQMPGTGELDLIPSKRFNRLNVISFDLRYTTFFSNIAPVGSFLTVKGGVNRISFADENALVSLVNDVDYTQEVGTNQLYLGVQLGKQRVILDRFLLKYGVEFHITGYYGYMISDYFDTDYGTDWFNTPAVPNEAEFIEDVQTQIKRRVGKQTAIMFTLSLGVLAP